MQAALNSQPQIRMTMAISRQTRNGVKMVARPTSACRPIGPPITSLARLTVGSVQLGMTRSVAVNDADRASAGARSAGASGG